jgi:hypothetical protein
LSTSGRRDHPRATLAKENHVEVTIGVQNLARELVIETEETTEAVAAVVSAALAGGPALELLDSRGRRVIVPTSSIGYGEIGTEEQRRVGFGSL